MKPVLEIAPDIRSARTPPGSFYVDPEVFAQTRDSAFPPSWQLAGRAAELACDGAQHPFVQLPGVLEEPLTWVRDGETLRCLSNVCSHRGHELVAAPCRSSKLRCRYHGRRFRLDGSLEAAPGFEGCADFPGELDSLAEIDSGSFGPWLFSRLAPGPSFSTWLMPLQQRAGGLPFDRLVHAPERDRTYSVDAHWALYVDNFLEGFHIPYVHPTLNAALSSEGYATELFEHASLQSAIAREGDPALSLAEGPHAGARVAALYFWFFPNLMLNIYPWGVSVNVVRPLTPNKTEVDFSSWVWDSSLMASGAGADLDSVELEDEAAVASVQRGIRARLYRGGRYSPAHERGTHHFHRLLAESLASRA